MQNTLSRSCTDFIDDTFLESLLKKPVDPLSIEDIIAKSLEKKSLSLEETAALLQADSPAMVEKIKAAAAELKQRIYGNRIVLFAPLYVGNHCINNCAYCGFKRSNKDALRKTLSPEQLQAEVGVLLSEGHKRLILVYGEHPQYDASFIAKTVQAVYAIHSNTGSNIRRVNINAAPLDHEGFKVVKSAGIGTYQIFQETYHHATYRSVHPENTRKGDYLWRLDSLSRALESGCDDVGIGALVGLYNWKFEVLGLVQHALFLQKNYNCGPHTISFPRLKKASNVSHDTQWLVSDDDFKRMVAILRLAIPYTGLILTCRESAELRREVLTLGISQIDAGSRIEIGGYSQSHGASVHEKQFMLSDDRSLDAVVRELAESGYMPSFCTACYRKQRTGEHFMELAEPGFIQNFCTPNALLSSAEYAEDYASAETRKALQKIETENLNSILQCHSALHKQTVGLLEDLRRNKARDLYF